MSGKWGIIGFACFEQSYRFIENSFRSKTQVFRLGIQIVPIDRDPAMRDLAFFLEFVGQIWYSCFGFRGKV